MTQPEQLKTIGQVARLSGVTAKALRHYDRIGLLRPADIDPATGYRRYTAAQVEQARLIRRLRELELPLDEVRVLLTADQPAFRGALAGHRRRIDARLTRLRGVLHKLDHALTDEDWTAMSDETPTPAGDDKQLHRHWGKTLFNDTWRLMEKEDRTPDDDALMIHQAHASAYHWMVAGTPANIARGHWQCSRVYCVVGRAEPALFHARAVLETCRAHGIGDWDLAFAYEALARAHALAGDREEARRYVEQARLVEIAEDDDRELLLADLETVPV